MRRKPDATGGSPESAAGRASEDIGFAMLAFAAALNAGNLGPAAGAMAADLDVSLATVGFVGGTVFFAGLVVAKLGAARYTEAVGSTAGVRTCCLAGIAGNLIIAASPAIAGIAAGRLVTGISLGLTLVLGPVLARRAGGVRLVGVFGAAVTIGTAAALAAGSWMRGGLDWRLISSSRRRSACWPYRHCRRRSAPRSAPAACSGSSADRRGCCPPGGSSSCS